MKEYKVKCAGRGRPYTMVKLDDGREMRKSEYIKLTKEQAKKSATESVTPVAG